MAKLLIGLIIAFAAHEAARASLTWDFSTSAPNGLPNAWTGYGFSVQNSALTNNNGTAFPDLGVATTPSFRYADAAASGATPTNSPFGTIGEGAVHELFTITISALTCDLGGGDNCDIELLRVDQNNAVVELLWSGAHSGSFSTTVEYPVVEASGVYSVRVTAYDYNDPTVLVNLSDLTISHAELTSEDFNHNGAVDAADYVLWRNNLYNEGSPFIVGDADGNGFVNFADYQVWRNHFSGRASGIGSSFAVTSANVPEPTLLLLFGEFSVFGLAVRRR